MIITNDDEQKNNADNCVEQSALVYGIGEALECISFL
jgi:hypothetical protein